MGFFKRLGHGLATTIFSTLLVVFALSMSAYMVLDKPPVVKKALADSGVYSVLVDNTLDQKQQQLGAYLPVDDPAVQKAVREAFPTSYLQTTIEHNVDATYDWIHGLTQKPHYSADLSQPKDALAANIGQLVAQHVSGLPVCKTVSDIPTTVGDVLALDCRPAGISADYLVKSAQSGVAQSSLFDQTVKPVLTLQDEQGQSLTDSLSAVPDAYHKFLISLYVVPAVLVLAAVAILFWSESKRQALKTVARSLIVTGIISILFSFAAVWLIGKAGQWSAGSSNDLILVESKIVEIAHLLGAQLRNWLAIIGGGYVLIGIILLAVNRFVGMKDATQNRALNKSLGYNDNIPQAGTTFDPQRTEGSRAPQARHASVDPGSDISKDHTVEGKE